MARVDWHPIAQRQLDEAIQFIEADRLGLGRAFARRVVLATERLQDFPLSGRVVPGSESEFREVIVGRFRLMYGISDGRVIILAVVHGARDFDSEDLPHD